MKKKHGRVGKKQQNLVCVECDDFQPLGNYGECQKYGWLVATELARRDAICQK